MTKHRKSVDPYITEEYQEIAGDEYKAFEQIDEQHREVMRAYGIDVRLETVIVDLWKGWIFDRITGQGTKIKIRNHQTSPEADNKCRMSGISEEE